MTNQIMHDNSQQMQSPQSIADYLAQLLKDRKQLAALPNVFTHLERLLDEGESRNSWNFVNFFLFECAGGCESEFCRWEWEQNVKFEWRIG